MSSRWKPEEKSEIEPIYENTGMAEGQEQIYENSTMGGGVQGAAGMYISLIAKNHSLSYIAIISHRSTYH